MSEKSPGVIPTSLTVPFWYYIDNERDPHS